MHRALQHQQPGDPGHGNLRPETIRTLVAAFAWQARTDPQLNLSVFRYSMSDIIRTTPLAGGRARFANLGSGWQADLQALHVADRRRAAGDPRPSIADYTTVDLTLRSPRLRAGWDFMATLRNAFDADVREPSLAPGLSLPNDLPKAGPQWALQAQCQF